MNERSKGDMVRNMAVMFLMVPMLYGLGHLFCVKKEAETTIQQWTQAAERPYIPSTNPTDTKAASEESKVKTVKFRTPICIMGTLYYEWEGRPKGMCIPVLDTEGNPIECADKE